MLQAGRRSLVPHGGDGRCDGGRSGDGNRNHAAKQGMTQRGIDGNLMLRPWVHDLTPENPTAKIAKTYSIKDFESRSNRFVVEAKYVRDKAHGKSIVGETNDDIETYRYHPSCDDLIFCAYDPNSFIPDTAALDRHLRSNRT
jgi:hypothetical protein